MCTLIAYVTNSTPQDVSDVFDDLEDMKQYVRRAGKFLPEKIDMVQYQGRTARESKVLFIEFKRDTDRARLAADVEIKVPILIRVALMFLLMLMLIIIFPCVVERHVLRPHRAE